MRRGGAREKVRRKRFEPKQSVREKKNKDEAEAFHAKCG